MKKVFLLVLFLILLSSTSSAETLSQFMLRTASSWRGIIPVVSAQKVGEGKYQVRVDVAAKPDQILIHIFNDDFDAEEVAVFSETAIEATKGQWVGCEVIVAGQSYLGIVQCGDYVPPQTTEDNEL